MAPPSTGIIAPVMNDAAGFGNPDELLAYPQVRVLT
jgi:hypothetical protein